VGQRTYVAIVAVPKGVALFARLVGVPSMAVAMPTRSIPMTEMKVIIEMMERNKELKIGGMMVKIMVKIMEAMMDDEASQISPCARIQRNQSANNQKDIPDEGKGSPKLLPAIPQVLEKPQTSASSIN
jgi:hypothetical protein